MGFILCRSRLDDQSHREFMSAMTLLWPEDSFIDILPSLWLWVCLPPSCSVFSEPCEKGCDKGVPSGPEQSTVSHSPNSD